MRHHRPQWHAFLCQAAVLLLPLLLLGCQKETGAFAFVTVDLDSSASGLEIYQLRSVAENGSESNEARFPAVIDQPLTFPKSYIIELGTRAGELRVRVEGLGPDGTKVVARASTLVEIRPMGQVSVPLRLKKACAATLGCMEVPGNQVLHMPSPETASRAGNSVASGPLSGGEGDDIIVGAQERTYANAKARGEVAVIFNDPLPTETLQLQSGAVDVLVRMACPLSCGDFFCSPDEDALRCPKDCAGTCNQDGQCGSGETCGSCPEDCGACEVDATRCSDSSLGNTVVAAAFDEERQDLVVASVASSAVYIVHGPLARQGAGTLLVEIGKREASAVPYTLLKGPKEAGFGYSVALGDVIGNDGKPDLVIGAQLLSPDTQRNRAGGVFVVPNELLHGGVVDLEGPAYPPGVVVVLGASAGEALGASVAVDDVTGDGLADLVLGAPRAAFSGRSDAGKVYVLAGPLVPGATGIRDLASPQGAAELELCGAAARSNIGMALAVGDLTGDAVSDVAVSSPQAGTVCVVAGPLLPGTPREIPTTAECRSLIRNAGTGFGSTITVADVHGDGIQDLVVGAPGNTAEPGRVIVMRGGADLPATVDFQGMPTDVPGADIVITGVPGDGLGAGIAVVAPHGRGSPLREILVGAPGVAAAYLVPLPE